jgi:hypothetical protein
MKKEWCKYKPDWIEYTGWKKYRCPICKKRLYPSKKYCVGGEFVGYKLPLHKEKK